MPLWSIRSETLPAGHCCPARPLPCGHPRLRVWTANGLDRSSVAVSPFMVGLAPRRASPPSWGLDPSTRPPAAKTTNSPLSRGWNPLRSPDVSTSQRRTFAKDKSVRPRLLLWGFSPHGVPRQTELRSWDRLAAPVYDALAGFLNPLTPCSPFIPVRFLPGLTPSGFPLRRFDPPDRVGLPLDRSAPACRCRSQPGEPDRNPDRSATLDRLPGFHPGPGSGSGAGRVATIPAANRSSLELRPPEDAVPWRLPRLPEASSHEVGAMRSPLLLRVSIRQELGRSTEMDCPPLQAFCTSSSR